MNIRIIITNDYGTTRRVRLFDALLKNNKHNYGYQKRINIDAMELNKNGNPEPVIDCFLYNKILNGLTAKHLQCKVLNSSDNRKLFFQKRTPIGSTYYIEPCLDENGKPREKVKSREHSSDWRYQERWYPSLWNIADTHEYFELDFALFIDVYVKPKEKFFLYLNFVKPMNFNTTTGTKIQQLC